MSARLARFAAVVATTALLSGCGDSSFGIVRGRVTLDGVPVKDGVIQFTPVNKDAPTANCFIKDGAYSAKVPVTTHRVVISSPRTTGGGKKSDSPTLDESRVQESIPAKYNTKSELTVEVRPGEAEVDFNLSR